MPLTLESRFREDVYIIQCTGRIVLGDEVNSLDAALGRCVCEFCQVVLNISEVNRLDSIGLGLIVRYMTNLRKRGGDLRLAAPPPFAVKLPDLTVLSGVIQTHPTEQAAVLSFLTMHSVQKTPAKQGPRVLVVDPSADLCVFVRSVLMQHGFDVKSTSLVRDAKVRLQVGDIDFILVGPSTPQLSSETVAGSLGAVDPTAAVLQLSPDFKGLHAHEAAESLLRMFGTTGPSTPDA